MTTTLVTRSGAISRATTKTCSGLQVALDAQKARRAERAAHRTTDLGRDADGAPAFLGDHDRLYEVAVVGHEEVLARPVRRSHHAVELQNGGLRSFRERGPQAFRERGGLLPAPHQAAAEGIVGLPKPVGGFAPVFEDPLHVRYEFPGLQCHSPLLVRRKIIQTGR
jgi:hypothetical protein